MTFKPVIEKTHTLRDGIQKLYRFKNGYGASVVRFKLGVNPIIGIFAKNNIYGSYTNNKNEWEVAVIKWFGDEDDDFKIHYDNKVADGDVIGHVQDEDLQKLLKRISKLKEIK